MLVNFKRQVRKYNIKITGVVYVGAHYGEEVPDYIECGVERAMLFEPLKENFGILADRVKDFDIDITLHQKALGSGEGKGYMNLSSNHNASSSLLEPKKHLELHPSVSFEGVENVEISFLDKYDCEGYNFISLDVQGYELEVLKGASKTLENIDAVLCEVNRAEVYKDNAFIEQIDEFLSKYNMERLDTSWDGDLWGDAFYMRKDLLL